MASIKVLNAEDLAEGCIRIIEIAGIEIGLIRWRDRVYAYRNLCPHQGGPACEGLLLPKTGIELHADGTFKRNTFDEDNMHIVCPWHGWEFKLETGESAGDPNRRLKAFPVQEKDGEIHVDI